MATVSAATSGLTEPSTGFIATTVRDLRALASSPRELWLIFGVKLLESVAYFAIYNLLVVYLQEDLHYGDIAGGSLAGTWLTAISILTFVSGFIADSLGIRRAMIASVTSCVLGRLLLTVGSSRTTAIAGLVVMTWGVASMIPTMTAAVRQYTRRSTVAFGFSLFYVLMNVGALIAPLTVGWFRRHYGHGAELFGSHLSSSRLIFAVGLLATAASFGLVLAMRPDDVVARLQGEDPDEAQLASGESAEKKRSAPWVVFREVVGESTFWRFMALVSLLVLVKLIFQHAHLTWPKYALREFGSDFDFASYWAINPAMIILLTPLATAFTRRRSAFTSIVAGAFLSAVSVLFMAVSTTVAASVAFIVTLSLGEVLWSPRLYEYTATIAPKGREASYMGLSQLPMFLAKPFVGFLSGYLLAGYCPTTGPRESTLMWAIIGAMTLVGPVMLVLLRRVIEGPKLVASSEV